MPLDFEIGGRVVFTVSDVTLRVEAGETGAYAGEQEGVHRVKLESGGDVVFRRDHYDGLRHAAIDESVASSFCVGDRVLFGKNDRGLGVQNGLLGEITALDASTVNVLTDRGDSISVDVADYQHLSLGYATTIHKSQGMTVDHAFVLASPTMDRHLGYVSLSRHRESVRIYVPDERFGGRSFESALARSSRHHSALDLADELGLSRLTQSITEESAMLSTSTSEGTTSQSNDRDGRTEVVAAQRRLDAEAERIVAVMRNAHDRETSSLDRALAATQDALSAHLEGKPSSGLFAKRSRSDEWLAVRQELEGRVSSARRAAAEHRALSDGLALRWQHEAMREARRLLPDAASLVESDKVARRLDQDLANWQKLNEEWERSDDPSQSAVLVERLLHLTRALEKQFEKTPDRIDAATRASVRQSLERAGQAKLRLQERGLER